MWFCKEVNTDWCPVPMVSKFPALIRLSCTVEVKESTTYNLRILLLQALHQCSCDCNKFNWTLIITGLFGALISTPSNIAVLKGQEVALNCSTNTTGNKLLWYVLLPETTREELIFDGYDVNQIICFCSVQHDNEQSTLYLPANESTAARYTCTETYNGARAIAQLIVLGEFWVIQHQLSQWFAPHHLRFFFKYVGSM